MNVKDLLEIKMFRDVLLYTASDNLQALVKSHPPPPNNGSIYYKPLFNSKKFQLLLWQIFKTQLGAEIDFSGRYFVTNMLDFFYLPLVNQYIFHTSFTSFLASKTHTNT